jgi:cation diffusion facilitator CzcD-associated flavoprotein CzcO
MTTNGERRSPSVAVVGAGLTGICAAIKLREAGIRDLTIYEKAPSVGGSWFYNRYPGLQCDVPSRVYSYTFAPNPDWSALNAPRDELWRYLEWVVDEFALRERIRFGSEVVSAEFEGAQWRIRTSTGETRTVDFLITATGILHHPRHPAIAGLETFAGDVFHSAEWDDSVPLSGRRVAVVGTGSTGVQLVGALAGVAGELRHFVRTPQWIFPLPNRRYSRLTRFALRRWPVLNQVAYKSMRLAFASVFDRAMIHKGWQRNLVHSLCRWHLRLAVRDAELRSRLTPAYEPMCKRLVMSMAYYPAIKREHVDVVTEPIDHIEPGGIVTADGSLHELDALILATGFHSQAYMRPMALVGEDGITLDQLWSGDPYAYDTVALPHFPNFFMLCGPHYPSANQSWFEGAEIQADYVAKWVRLYMDGVYDLAAPTEAATQRFRDQVREAYPGEAAWATGCASWYMGREGIPMIWPWRQNRYRQMLSEPRVEDFELGRVRHVAPAATSDASAMGVTE